CLPFRRTRTVALNVLAMALTFAMVEGTVLSLTGPIRSHAFLALAQRSNPLTRAIERFEADHGCPPHHLNELVPEYIASIPVTGMGAHPTYEYVSGVQAQNAYADRWALVVDAGEAPTNFDTFWYAPTRHYPKEIDGQWVEPIGDWAYLHE